MYSKKVEYKNGTLFGPFFGPQSNCRVALVVFPPETNASRPVDTVTEPIRHQFRVVLAELERTPLAILAAIPFASAPLWQ